MKKDDVVKKISEIFHQTSEAHHGVFKEVNGNDPDWASWYSFFLLDSSDFSKVLGRSVYKPELTYFLIKLDREYAEEKPREKWEDYYAKKLLEHFKG